MNPTYIFTVFTPTYNRAHTLPRVYASLCAQTLRDFEWLIIDDGSTDGTGDLVAGWQGEADFPIRYIWQENGGKHVAHNRALGEARGRLFLPLDSDDEVMPNALEHFLGYWETIPDSAREGYSSVTGHCIDQHGALVGDRFPQDPYDSNPLENFYRSKIHGEKFGFMRTDILRRFPFPVIPGDSGYVAETVVWTRVARRYQTRYVNEILRIYYVDDPDIIRQVRGRTSYMRRNARGTVLRTQQVLNEHIDYLWDWPAIFWREAVVYVRISLLINQGYVRQWRGLDNFAARAIWATSLPLGTVLFLRDRWRERLSK